MGDMKHLVTAEGLAALSNKIEPIQLRQGILPFNEHTAQSGVHDKPVDANKPISVRDSGLNLAGYTAFTLGPVYWSLRIPFDLVHQFLHSEYGVGANTKRLLLPRKILPDVPGWEDVIEVVNSESWDNLVLFLSECMFTRGENYWSLCGDFCRVRIVRDDPSITSQVAVFTPRGMRTRIRPTANSSGVIRLLHDDASPDMSYNSYNRKMTLLAEKGTT